MTTKKILILGGGFGGIYAALKLEKLMARQPELEVTLVTRENYFLFTPMLPEVAAGDLELNTIVNPLRKLLKRVKTFVGTIEALNLEGRQVTISHGLDGHSHELLLRQLWLSDHPLRSQRRHSPFRKTSRLISFSRRL
jgi:NADH dehydrogenase